MILILKAYKRIRCCLALDLRCFPFSNEVLANNIQLWVIRKRSLSLPGCLAASQRLLWELDYLLAWF